MNLPNTDIESYPDNTGKLHPIPYMTVSFLKNAIEYIEATGNNISYLNSLKTEYKKRKKFKFIIINN